MGNVVVEDASSIQRVILGDISAAGDGSNYGIKVVSSDGVTVVIDGTSDVFKIALTTTQTTAGVTNTTLSALGSGYSVAPVYIAHYKWSADPNNYRRYPGAALATSAGAPSVWADVLIAVVSGTPVLTTVVSGTLSSGTVTSFTYVLVETNL